jgi:hypothetical protein
LGDKFADASGCLVVSGAVVPMDPKTNTVLPRQPVFYKLVFVDGIQNPSPIEYETKGVVVPFVNNEIRVWPSQNVSSLGESLRKNNSVSDWVKQHLDTIFASSCSSGLSLFDLASAAMNTTSSSSSFSCSATDGDKDLMFTVT